MRAVEPNETGKPTKDTESQKEGETSQCNTILEVTGRRLPLELSEQVYLEAMQPLPDRVYLYEYRPVYGLAADYRPPTPPLGVHQQGGPTGGVYSSKRLLGESKPLLPDLCYTNKTIFAESMPVFIRNTTFDLESQYKQFDLSASSEVVAQQELLVRVLQSIPDGQGFASVRNLKYGSLMQFAAAQKYAPLLPWCTGLRELTLRVDRLDLSTSEAEACWGLFRCLEVVLDWYKVGLELLVDCPNLKTVTLWWAEDAPWPSHGIHLAVGIQEWLQEAFRKEGKKVDVRIVQ